MTVRPLGQLPDMSVNSEASSPLTLRYCGGYESEGSDGEGGGGVGEGEGGGGLGGASRSLGDQGQHKKKEGGST